MPISKPEFSVLLSVYKLDVEVNEVPYSSMHNEFTVILYRREEERWQKRDIREKKGWCMKGNRRENPSKSKCDTLRHVLEGETIGMKQPITRV